jgi:hypothetical protein
MDVEVLWEHITTFVGLGYEDTVGEAGLAWIDLRECWLDRFVPNPRQIPYFENTSHQSFEEANSDSEEYTLPERPLW